MVLGGKTATVDCRARRGGEVLGLLNDDVRLRGLKSKWLFRNSAMFQWRCSRCVTRGSSFYASMVRYFEKY